MHSEAPAAVCQDWFSCRQTPKPRCLQGAAEPLTRWDMQPFNVTINSQQAFLIRTLWNMEVGACRSRLNRNQACHVRFARGKEGSNHSAPLCTSGITSGNKTKAVNITEGSVRVKSTFTALPWLFHAYFCMRKSLVHRSPKCAALMSFRSSSFGASFQREHLDTPPPSPTACKATCGERWICSC